MKCPACGNGVSSDRSTCAQCGAQLPMVGRPEPGFASGPPNPKTETLPISLWDADDDASPPDPAPAPQDPAGWDADIPPAYRPAAGRPPADGTTEHAGTSWDAFSPPPGPDPSGWNQGVPPADQPPPDGATQHLGAPWGGPTPPPGPGPAGWAPGVPPAPDGMAAAPTTGGRTGDRRQLALLAGGIVAVVVLGGGIAYALTQGSGQASAGGGQAGAGSAAQQAAAVNAVLKSGDAARRHLPAHMRTCAQVSADVPAFQRVVRDRQHELAETKKLHVDKLADGPRLRTAMIAAYQSSLDADRAYLAWARKIRKRGCGHRVAPLIGPYKKAIAANNKAGPAKRRVVAVWNPIATGHHLPTYTWERI